MENGRNSEVSGQRGAVSNRPLPQVRCVCNRRLFDGELVGEIKCPKCGRLMKFVAPEKKSA